MLRLITAIAFWPLALATVGCTSAGGDDFRDVDGGSDAGVVEPDCAAVDDARCFYVAPDGDDSADGSIEAPFKTFKTALVLVAPGDFIYARGGVYGRENAMIASAQRLPQAEFPAPCAEGQTLKDNYCQVPRPMFAAINSWGGYPLPE